MLPKDAVVFEIRLVWSYGVSQSSRRNAEYAELLNATSMPDGPGFLRIDEIKGQAVAKPLSRQCGRWKTT